MALVNNRPPSTHIHTHTHMCLQPSLWVSMVIHVIPNKQSECACPCACVFVFVCVAKTHFTPWNPVCLTSGSASVLLSRLPAWLEWDTECSDATPSAPSSQLTSAVIQQQLTVHKAKWLHLWTRLEENSRTCSWSQKQPCGKCCASRWVLRMGRKRWGGRAEARGD